MQSYEALDHPLSHARLQIGVQIVSLNL